MPSASYGRATEPVAVELLTKGLTPKSDLIKVIAISRRSLADDEMDDNVSDDMLELRNRNMLAVTNAMRAGNLAEAIEALRAFWSDVPAKSSQRPKTSSAFDIASAVTAQA